MRVNGTCQTSQVTSRGKSNFSNKKAPWSPSQEKLVPGIVSFSTTPTSWHCRVWHWGLGSWYHLYQHQAWMILKITYLTLQHLPPTFHPPKPPDEPHRAHPSRQVPGCWRLHARWIPQTAHRHGCRSLALPGSPRRTNANGGCPDMTCSVIGGRLVNFADGKLWSPYRFQLPSEKCSLIQHMIRDIFFNREIEELGILVLCTPTDPPMSSPWRNEQSQSHQLPQMS